VNDTRSTGAIRSVATKRTLNGPQLGARVRMPRGIELRGNLSQASRAPDFDELFGIDGSVTGNPALLPETSESWDAGLAYDTRVHDVALRFEWSAHATHARNLILFERSSPRGARPINVGEARMRGEESSLRAAWRTWELSASSAWLSATDRSPIAFYHGRRLPQRAGRQSYARLAWRPGRFTFASEVEYLGDTFLDRANFSRSPSRTLVAASIGMRVARTRVLLEGRNLGDRLAEDVSGFPLPGRTLRAALTLDLGMR
jgi:outer membrane cobalamin receptor